MNLRKSNHLQSHNIIDIKNIQDNAFYQRLVNFGHRNIWIQQVKFNDSTGIAQYRILVNNFCFLIRVLHVVQCAPQIIQPHLILGRGGNGLVHIKEGNRKFIAVKRLIFHSETNIHKYLMHISQIQRTPFLEDSFCNEFKTLLIELTLAKLCSAFKIGSAVLNDFPFDAICYQNCFQFFQQVCQVTDIYSQEQYQEYVKDLELNTRILHQELLLAHCDIKPQNIMYSRQYQKYVFVDFGSSEVVNGDFNVVTIFKGTRYYWSEEMEKLYIDNKNSRRNKEQPKARLVDLQKHDRACIEKTKREVRRDMKKEESPQSPRMEYQRKAVSNEYSLFEIVKALVNYKDHNDLITISRQVDINKTIQYCVDNKKFLQLVKFVIRELEKRGREVEIPPKTRQIQNFFIKYRNSADSKLEALLNLQIRYTAQLRINGYTQYAMGMEDELKQNIKFLNEIPEIPEIQEIRQIPKISDEIKKCAMQIYQKQSTVISFGQNNKIKLKGAYVFSTIERDLIDIKQHEKALLLQLSYLTKYGATINQQSKVQMKLFHLLFLKFNSNFCILKRIQILDDLRKLHFLGKPQKKMLDLYWVIYNFKYGEQGEQKSLEKALRSFLKHSNDKYYQSLSLEQASKIYETLGKIEQAVKLLTQCIENFKRMYKDEDHIIMEVRYQRWAELKLQQGCYQEALKYYDKIKAMNQKYSRSGSLCLSLLRSKLCFYQKTIDKLEECVEDARLKLQEHFSHEHPFFLRFQMAVTLRQKLPISKKQALLQHLIHRFLEGIGIKNIEDYIKFRKQAKANYGFIKNHEIFKLFIQGMYTISLQRFDYRSAQRYLLVLIEVEYGVTLHYHLYLLKLMIQTMQQRKAIMYSNKCQELLQKQGYPKESELFKYFQYLKFKYDMTFQMWELSEQNRLKKLNQMVSRKDDAYAYEMAIEGYIMMARMEVHYRPFEGTKQIYQNSRNLLQKAMELEESNRNRPQILNSIEEQISELYTKTKQKLEFTQIHITNGIEHIKAAVECKHQYFSRNMLLIQAKNLYYNQIDIEKAYKTVKKCLTYFSTYGGVNIGNIQTCYLLSQIEQTRTNYAQSFKYAMKCLKLTSELMPQPSSLLFSCSNRLSSILREMKKKCLCAYPIDLYSYYEDHVPYVKTHSARKPNTNSSDEQLEDSEDFKQIRTFLSSYKKYVDPFRQLLKAGLVIKMIVHEKRLLKIINRQKMRCQQLIKIRGSSNKKDRTIPHQRETLFRIYVKMLVLNEKQKALEYYNRIFVDLSQELCQRFIKIFDEFNQDLNL